MTDLSPRQRAVLAALVCAESDLWEHELERDDIARIDAPGIWPDLTAMFPLDGEALATLHEMIDVEP
jgi:hypothetical protein